MTEKQIEGLNSQVEKHVLPHGWVKMRIYQNNDGLIHIVINGEYYEFDSFPDAYSWLAAFFLKASTKTITPYLFEG